MIDRKNDKEKSSFNRAMEVLLLLAFGFMGGYAYDINEYKDCQEDNVNIMFERDSLEIEILFYKNSVDWNAIKNIEANDITNECRRCNPKVSEAFKQLDTRRDSSVFNVVVQ